jgi:hypothetical protein
VVVSIGRLLFSPKVNAGQMLHMIAANHKASLGSMHFDLHGPTLWTMAIYGLFFIGRSTLRIRRWFSDIWQPRRTGRHCAELGWERRSACRCGRRSCSSAAFCGQTRRFSLPKGLVKRRRQVVDERIPPRPAYPQALETRVTKSQSPRRCVWGTGTTCPACRLFGILP